MKFLSQIIFLDEKKNSKNNLGERNLLQILETPKNFMISFFHLLKLRGKNSFPKFSFFFPHPFFQKVIIFFKKESFFSTN